jgi:hypothetical protein
MDCACALSIATALSLTKKPALFELIVIDSGQQVSKPDSSGAVM